VVGILNQVAVVTGAGRGIGHAIAVELGQLGAKVVLAARSRTELEATARLIGSSASVIRTDVRKKQELERLFEQVTTTLGPVDILVNAAAASSTLPPSPVRSVRPLALSTAPQNSALSVSPNPSPKRLESMEYACP